MYISWLKYFASIKLKQAFLAFWISEGDLYQKYPLSFEKSSQWKKEIILSVHKAVLMWPEWLIWVSQGMTETIKKTYIGLLGWD